MKSGVLGYIGILYHKENPPEVWHIPPGTPVYIFRVYGDDSSSHQSVIGIDIYDSTEARE
jgi:hypothetical protein